MENKFLNSEFQIFFSGVESDRYFDIVTEETNAVLMSYLYIQRKGKKFLQERFEKHPDLRLMIDSGAHTFIAKEDEYRKTAENYKKKHGTDYWENYLEKYTAFARENKEHVFAVVELDIDYLVGQEKVEEYREKYFKPLEEEGIQVIYVWHNIRGLQDWERMCNKYDYVGFSIQMDSDMTVDMATKMVNIAKRFGAKVHGFACTGLDYMQKAPFFTVDSTTWLVGTQFGEVNFFDGRTMKRLKKDKWKRQFKNKLIQLGANWNLAEREEPYELIRINVLTFLKVEEYLRKIMKNKAYWMEGKKSGIAMPTRKPTTFIPEMLPPTKDFFLDEESEEYKDYAEILGIDLNLPKEDIICWIEAFYAFIKNDREIIDKYTDEEVFHFIDVFGFKAECNTRKKSLEVLPKCFTEHACAERHELENYAQVLASAGEAPPKALEREEYLEEESHIIVDIPAEEVEEEVKKLLPAGKTDADFDMPEVDAYDEELKQTGIIPVRDESGKLLKGHKAVRKPKQIYSDLMPKLSCDTCIKAGSCPDYVAGYVCAYNKLFKRFDSRNTDDVEDAIASMVNHNLQRMQQQMVFEMLDGGIADPTVTGMIDQNIKLLSLMQSMKSNQKQVVATRKVVMDENGKATEVVETVSANPAQGGILSKLFSASSSPIKEEIKDEDDQVATIDVDAKDI